MQHCNGEQVQREMQFFHLALTRKPDWKVYRALQSMCKTVQEYYCQASNIFLRGISLFSKKGVQYLFITINDNIIIDRIFSDFLQIFVEFLKAKGFLPPKVVRDFHRVIHEILFSDIHPSARLSILAF